MKIESTTDLEKIRQEYSNKLYYPDSTKVLFGMASCGIAAGAKAAFEKALAEFPQGNGIQLSQTGCLGFCEVEPLIEIAQAGRPRIIYQNITEDKIVDVIHSYLEKDFKKKKWILGQVRDPRSLMEDQVENPVREIDPIEKIPFLEDTPFYQNQVKIAMRNCGYIDPDCIEEYIARGGYFAFFRALFDHKPEEVIQIVKDSGLRGRGGGGFQPGLNGRPAPGITAKDISFAMPMKATRALTWTEAFWKEIPTAFWKGC